jgi:hypothetical protein
MYRGMILACGILPSLTDSQDSELTLRVRNVAFFFFYTLCFLMLGCKKAAGISEDL